MSSLSRMRSSGSPSLSAFSGPFSTLSNLYLPTLPRSYLRESKNNVFMRLRAFSALGGSPGRSLL